MWLCNIAAVIPLLRLPFRINPTPSTYLNTSAVISYIQLVWSSVDFFFSFFFFSFLKVN